MLNMSNQTSDCLFPTFVEASELQVLQIPTMILCVVNIILAVTASTGNALIIAAICKNSNLRTPTNTLICALAFSDFGVGILVHLSFVPFKIGQIQQEKLSLYCFSQSFNFSTGFLFSLFSLLIITSVAIERYLALRLGTVFNSTVTISRMVKVAAGSSLFSFALLLLFIAKFYRVMDIITLLAILCCLIVNLFAYFKISKTSSV